MTTIEYGFSESPFGEIIVARTVLGICDLQFLEHNKLETIHELAQRWGVYTPTTQSDQMAHNVERVIFEGLDRELTLDLRGTEFQKQVWHELQRIPFGQTASYQEIADRIGNPKGVRAVASAVAQNPIAMLIPCHRVIHSDGTTGEYHWGRDLKRRLIEWEAAKVAKE
ncbi:MAG: methylated-DNA--[protein]-cysteine S-methyltransferase [Prevotella sp.]|nr:methylated-DNA--[protein]-cysteine S-methyltransferase [Prevotella sp.]